MAACTLRSKFAGRKEEGTTMGAAKDILFGKWLELRGRVRQKWGELTDDDLTRLSGQREELAGILQQRFGYATAETEISEWLGDHSQRPANHDL